MSTNKKNGGEDSASSEASSYRTIDIGHRSLHMAAKWKREYVEATLYLISHLTLDHAEANMREAGWAVTVTADATRANLQLLNDLYKLLLRD